MTNLEIDGVRYRVVEKEVKVLGSDMLDVGYDTIPWQTIHVLEPIPYNAYKEKSDEKRHN